MVSVEAEEEPQVQSFQVASWKSSSSSVAVSSSAAQNLLEIGEKKLHKTKVQREKITDE